MKLFNRTPSATANSGFTLDSTASVCFNDNTPFLSVQISGPTAKVRSITDRIKSILNTSYTSRSDQLFEYLGIRVSNCISDGRVYVQFENIKSDNIVGPTNSFFIDEDRNILTTIGEFKVIESIEVHAKLYNVTSNPSTISVASKTVILVNNTKYSLIKVVTLGNTTAYLDTVDDTVATDSIMCTIYHDAPYYTAVNQAIVDINSRVDDEVQRLDQSFAAAQNNFVSR